MEKHYDPKKIEKKWYKLWEENNTFHNNAKSQGKSYCILIPPPNVTGILHMGHALNNTLQDIMVRWHRMQGENVVWMPGTDHAGIATQNVVERALKKENKSRKDLGRDAFLQRVWQWRKEYGSTIINQLKRLGSSCDWQRERFTMDDGMSNAVAEVFVRLYNKGLIYKGNYIINWCPRCQTALSEEESEHVDTKGKLYYIKYPIQNKKTLSEINPDNHNNNSIEYIVVATTRPETMLGDVAIAVNPNDNRYKKLIKKTVILPILNRELTVIRDDLVDPEFGTGIVKVTPAHDPNDFEMGQRHSLSPINIMNGDGSMNSETASYEGLDRFECRKKIIDDLQAKGLIEKIEEHNHAVGHCYRCDTTVEPRLSLQWFVKMKPLAKPAIEAVESGKIKFLPTRWTKVYLEWMKNIRDWCISRQIWWGHRIPVFYCDSCNHEWATKKAPELCPECGQNKIRQDEDVLDTWFSSWLWPFSTFGWPETNDDLAFYYPTNDLVTASEIIFFWVARMIMAGIEFMGDIPFKQVHIHGTVRDNNGRKMSKSLGNSIDPITIIDEYSADALRFSLMMITAMGQDVYVSNDKFEIGRNFGTKLWNAARFIQMQCKNEESSEALSLDYELLSPDDLHILVRLNEAISACTENLEKQRFNDAAHVLYEFIWHQFCNWYLEYSKNILYGDNLARKKQVMNVFNHVFSNALCLLHPMMPFVTEELWHAMKYNNESKFIMTSNWPTLISLDEKEIDISCVEYVDNKHNLIHVGRTLRSDYGILPSKSAIFLIKPPSEEICNTLITDINSIKSLLNAEHIEIDPSLEPGKAMPSGISKLGIIYMPLEGLIDVKAEIKRLSNQLVKITRNLENVTIKLENVNFISKAPENVVNRGKNKKQELIEKREKLNRLIETLISMN